MVKMFSFVLVTTALLTGRESWALENCLQEQARLRAQVHLLEIRVKRQQVKIAQLLQEKEIQFLDKGEEDSVIDLGGKRQYADPNLFLLRPAVVQQLDPLSSILGVKLPFPTFGIRKKPEPLGMNMRGWNDYENGFGNFVHKNGEYWLGNKNLHLLTIQGDYALKIDLADFGKNSRYAHYKNFKVGDEKNFYELDIGEYSGTAGDALAVNFHPEVQWWGSHQRMKFSTWDRDNDNYEGNCAEEEQSGWWFNRCHSANLNGLYYPGSYRAKTDNGIVWHTWHGWWYSLKSVVMKIRPNDFIPNIV
ncbi:Fibrinogen-like protein 1 [Pteropus alecto]|uniref:Fibrinogen-like protein 1 n=1 Tax=Pteropus alecto TaxID=9402 RepID=L5KDJ8_PTEAL|nr:Fibrinogen-like protein 1 [Pteropus alecto]